MKIYIASRYIAHKDINSVLSDILSQNGYEPFLPALINIEPKSNEGIILELMACGWWAFFNGRMPVLMILWKRVCTAITGGWKRG